MGKTSTSQQAPLNRKSLVQKDKVTKKTMELPQGNMDASEQRLVRNMRRAGLTFSDIEYITCRSSETVSKALKTTDAPVAVHPGQPAKISDATYKKLKGALDRLLKKAKGLKEVTVEMVKAEAGVEASNRCVLDALHSHGIWFNKLKEKPVLEAGDVKALKTDQGSLVETETLNRLQNKSPF